MPGLPEREGARDAPRDRAREGDRARWTRRGWQRIDDARPPADTRARERERDDGHNHGGCGEAMVSNAHNAHIAPNAMAAHWHAVTDRAPRAA